MSIQGFVSRSRERISVLRQQIEAKRIEGGGHGHPSRNTKGARRNSRAGNGHTQSHAAGN